MKLPELLLSIGVVGAALAIVAAQPVASVKELAGLYYVGTTALRALKEAAVAQRGKQAFQFASMPRSDSYVYLELPHPIGVRREWQELAPLTPQGDGLAQLLDDGHPVWAHYHGQGP